VALRPATTELLSSSPRRSSHLPRDPSVAALLVFLAVGGPFVFLASERRGGAMTEGGGGTLPSSAPLLAARVTVPFRRRPVCAAAPLCRRARACAPSGVTVAPLCRRAPRLCPLRCDVDEEVNTNAIIVYIQTEIILNCLV
jgi:hypothetical protein